MVKRGRGAEASNPHKRQKIVHEAPTSEEIHTSRQLMQLLAFDQDLQKARHGKADWPWNLSKLSLISFKAYNHSRSSSTGCCRRMAPTMRRCNY